MDEEIKAQIIPIIEGTKEGLAKAVDFLCEQSPILVKEILWWHGIRSAMWFAVLLAAFLVGIYYSRKFLLWVAAVDCKKECPTTKGCLFCPSLCFLFHVVIYGGGATILFTNLTWLKILVAPRLFLLEFLKDAIT